MDNRAQWLQQLIEQVDGPITSPAIPKHLKMAASPFVFFRGSSQLFYADIAAGNLPIPAELLDVPLTTVMGDCHVSNFGMITEEGSHGDDIVFAPNDFDDACVGHAVWDVLRYCVSLLLCQQHAETNIPLLPEQASVTDIEALRACEMFLQAYTDTCQAGIEDNLHWRQAVESGGESKLLKKAFKKARARAAGGEKFMLKSALAKAVDPEHIPLAFRSLSSKFLPVSDQLKQEIICEFSPYMDDTILDVVERINAGTGSVNMQRYYCLVGPDDFSLGDEFSQCHIVEVKQQRQAAPIRFFPDVSANNKLNPAHLTVMCQRRMQRRPDLVLDEVEWRDSHWLVRSRHHARVGFDPEDIAVNQQGMAGVEFENYARYCGQALALAHSRGDRRSLNFEQAARLAFMQHSAAIVNTAVDYAKRVTKDCQWLKQCIGEQVSTV